MHGAAAAAQDSLSGALSLHDPVVAVAAREAFVNGMHGAALVGAAVALAGALFALVALPARERRPAATLEPVPA